jgi:hypothetical protein
VGTDHGERKARPVAARPKAKPHVKAKSKAPAKKKAAGKKATAKK